MKERTEEGSFPILARGTEEGSAREEGRFPFLVKQEREWRDEGSQREGTERKEGFHSW